MISQYVENIRSDKNMLESKNRILLQNWDDDNSQSFQSIVLDPISHSNRKFLDYLPQTNRLKEKKEDMQNLLERMRDMLDSLRGM